MAEIKTTIATNTWLNHIRNRISRNKNFLLLISGECGSGKSWTALKLGELLDPGFNISRVVFTADELMDLLDSKKLPDRRGNVVIFDEAGIGANNRLWFSTANQIVNFILQSFRSRCIILIFTAPFSDFIDAQTRKLFNANFQTVYIDRKTQCVVVRPLGWPYSSTYKTPYPTFLKYLDKKEGRYIGIRRWNIPKPSLGIIKEYEDVKLLYVGRLYHNIRNGLDKERRQKGKTYVPCPYCDKKVLPLGLSGHIQLAHPEEWSKRHKKRQGRRRRAIAS